jgi:hypothetical protein
MPTFKLCSESVIDFCMVKYPNVWKYKGSALIPRCLLTFNLGTIPPNATDLRIVFSYFVEKSYRPGNTVYCYALVNKIPGDNYSYYLTQPRDLFYLGPGSDAILIDQFDSSFQGYRTVRLHDYPPIINYILTYKSLTFFWISSPLTNPSVRISSPLSPISSRRPNLQISYTGTPVPAQLVVYDDNIKFTPYTPMPGNQILAEITVLNNGAIAASNVDVELWDGSPFNGGNLLGTQIISEIPPGGKGIARFTWLGYHFECRRRIYAVVGRNFTFPEISNRTHIASRVLWVRNNFRIFTIDFENIERGEWKDGDENLISHQFSPPEEYEPHPPQNPSFVGIRLTNDDNHTVGGTRCFEFFFNGTHDNGSKWIWRAIPLDIPSGQMKEIIISLWAKHKEGSQMFGGNKVLAFCDNYIPEADEDFVIIGSIDSPHPNEWNNYSYTKQITGPFKGEIYIGVGIRVVNTEPTEIREYIDDIAIQINDVISPT